MQNAGEISSEAYKDLYHEYTLLGQKLKEGFQLNPWDLSSNQVFEN